jgi:hypothetical protein
MPGRIYPTEKKILLKMLSKDERKMIQKDYPFKNIRNAKYKELMDKGVSPSVLAEFTGVLSKSSVHRIGQTGGNNRILSDNEQALKNDLLKTKAAIDAFNKEMKKIFKHRRK